MCFLPLKPCNNPAYSIRSAQGKPEMWTSVSPWCKAARERERHGRLAAAGALNVMLMGEALGDVQAAWGPVAAGGLPGKAGGLLRTSTRPTLNPFLLLLHHLFLPLLLPGGY